ncbi:hypothetical protein [Streptococcus pneumoniae]|nr:hypothetical protein [Streptococcus pneumoniae]CIW14039.1 Uncharacterised protein [Streptococcus pneumoniae]
MGGFVSGSFSLGWNNIKGTISIEVVGILADLRGIYSRGHMVGE